MQPRHHIRHAAGSLLDAAEQLGEHDVLLLGSTIGGIRKRVLAMDQICTQQCELVAGNEQAPQTGHSSVFRNAMKSPI